MPKIIALQSTCSPLAKYLTNHGYTVVGLDSGIKSDAILQYAYHPEREALYNNMTEQAADITTGNYSRRSYDYPDTIIINITGLSFEQILWQIRQQLSPRHLY